MSWDDWRFFLAVQRRGSLKAAARALAVDPTTVGRRLAALEASLGLPLFERTAEGLRVTPAGLRLAARAERVEAEVLAASRELVGSDPALHGPLRVSATDGLVHYLLVPELAGLFREHPGLALELRSETHQLDLSRREADLALRLLRPREPALIARRIGVLAFGLYASGAYLEQRGAPRNVAALAAHPFIGFHEPLLRLPQLAWLRQHVPSARYVLRTNATTTQALACAEGHGLALLPAFVATREPRLRAVLPRLAGPSRELYGVYHADLRANPRIEAFLSWLSRTLAGLVGVSAPLT